MVGNLLFVMIKAVRAPKYCGFAVTVFLHTIYTHHKVFCNSMLPFGAADIHFFTFINDSVRAPSLSASKIFSGPNISCDNSRDSRKDIVWKLQSIIFKLTIEIVTQSVSM